VKAARRSAGTRADDACRPNCSPGSSRERSRPTPRTPPHRAKKFYSSVFGWKYKESDIPGVEYYIIDGVTPGGAINHAEEDP